MRERETVDAEGDARSHGGPRRLHVAVVDEELPYPANTGKRIRTLNLLTRLARRHRVTLMTRRNLKADEVGPAAAYLHERGIEPIVVDSALPPRTALAGGFGLYARLAANLLSPRPYVVDANDSPALREAVRSYDRGHEVHLWQCEWTPYAEALRDIEPRRKLIVAHNIESLIWRRYLETEASAPKRWYIRLQCRKFEDYERRAFRDVRSVVTVSEPDAVLARSMFGAPRVSVVENGVDTAHFQPTSSRPAAGPILFMGSLDWRPNLDAADQLLSVVFPAVRAADPTARFQIVGRTPPEWLRQRVAASPGVELHADVADVRPFLAQAAMMVVPLRIGGGSRLKILEALAAGTPVVSTRIGAEGLDVRDGEHLVLVEGCEKMARAILDHGRDDPAIERRIRAGRRLVEDHYDWDILANRLDAIWCEAAPDAAASPRGPEPPSAIPAEPTLA
jgi:glycosyltransferase involved in cell wall biosynthesis